MLKETDTSLSSALWHPLIEQQTKDVFCYNQSWLDLLTKLYGYTISPLTTTNASGQVTGILPLYCIQSPLTGRRFVSVPFSDHCPLLAADEASADALIDAAFADPTIQSIVGQA